MPSTQTPMIGALRAQFPSLHHDIDGQLPIYFDNPAGTQVPQRVIDATTDYYLNMNANVGGAFLTSQRTDAMIAATRQIVADFLNAPSPDEIVFGPNMTTLCFSLSRAIGKTLPADAEIVLTRMDHDANITPWQALADDLGLTVKWVELHKEDATLDMASFEAALSEKTKIVATIHAANSVGTINPMQQIAEMSHAVGAWHIVDAVQSAPHIPIDVQAIGCDFLLCSAYKFFGPHIGVLWGRYNLLAELPAYKVRPAKDVPPHRWETGTQSFETIIGVHEALAYLAQIGEQYGQLYANHYPQFSGRRAHFKTGMSTLAAYERELVADLIGALQGINGVEIAGITDVARLDWRVPTVAFTLANHTPKAIVEHLAQHYIYAWSGNYYALEIMGQLGHAQHGMVRVGLAHYNTHTEIERFAEVLGILAD